MLKNAHWIENHERIAGQASESPGPRRACAGNRESYILARLVMARKMNRAVQQEVCAQRGSSLGKKPDGEPSAMTIWLGMQEIALFIEGTRCARPSNDG